MRAASSSSAGTSSKKEVITQVMMGKLKMRLGRMSAADGATIRGRRIRRRLDLRLERERDHPVEDEDRGQHEETGERIEGGRGQPAAPRASPHHVVLLRTLIRISEAPMTTAKSATAIDEA